MYFCLCFNQRSYCSFGDNFSCSEFSDAAVAEATCEFLIENKRKLLASFPNLLPQVYKLLIVKLVQFRFYISQLLEIDAKAYIYHLLLSDTSKFCVQFFPLLLKLIAWNWEK